MKIVKDINKLIVKKVIEIFFMIGFVFLSTFLWNSKNTKDFLAVAAGSFNNLSYTNISIDNPINYSMYPMTDKNALEKLSPCYIRVSNDTYKMESYALVLKINKASTLDYQYLNIGIDNKIYSLNDLKRKDNIEEYLFILDEASIKGSVKTYEIKLWLNTTAGNDMQAKDLIMTFDLISETTKM